MKIFNFGSGAKGTESQNLRGAVVLGIVSGLAVGPCSIAYVSPVLSLAMSRSSFMLVIAYALGYAAVLVAAGTFAQLFTKFLQSERGDKVLKVINILCGVALIAGGIYFLYEMFLIFRV